MWLSIGEIGISFVAGFTACWFLIGDIKAEILKLRTDLSGVLGLKK